MADASCGGKAYLFDFLRMVRIDEATGEETGLAWIDHRGGCFFPAPADCGGGRNKRKRDDAPAPEDEAESSSGVDERSGESPGVGVDAKRRKAWGNAAARLEENDKYYQVVSKLFLSYGMAQRGDHGGAQDRARREDHRVPGAGAAARRRARSRRRNRQVRLVRRVR